MDVMTPTRATADPGLLPEVSHWLSTGRELQAAAKNETLGEVLDREKLDDSLHEWR